MYFGRLDGSAAIEFYHENSDIIFAPDSIQKDIRTWNWDSVYDSVLEARVSLGKRAYVSAVVLDLQEGSAIMNCKVLAAEADEGHEAGSIIGKYEAETGKDAGGKLLIPVGCSAQELTIRIKSCVKPISFRLEIWGSMEDEAPVIWPVPRSMEMESGSVLMGVLSCLDDGNEDEMEALFYLKERLEQKNVQVENKGGKTVKVVLSVEQKGYEGERYTVSVNDQEIRLTGGNRLCLMYAVDSLVRLVSAKGEVPCLEIDDRPYKPMRGFHMFLPPKDQLEFAKRVFKYVLVPLRYNMLFVEFAGGMRFDSHPEISEGWLDGNERALRGELPPFPHGVGIDANDGGVAGGKLLEKEEVRDMLDVAHQLGLDVIPEVQSFGHVQYITYSHPELAERAEEDYVVDDVRGEDARPAQAYDHCYCPSKEEVYPLIYDLIDEIVEVARPEHYVHMGHDEIYQVGICPICKKKKPEDLYLMHVTRMHDYLSKKGLKMMIWSDMLQPTERYLTYPAAKSLPKDIVMLDFIWYFHFDLDMEDHILPYGFDVIMGNFYSSHYPRYESRAAKDRMLGGEVSTWVRFDEYTLARNGKFWDLMYAAEMLWDPSYKEELRASYVHYLESSLQGVIRKELRGWAPEGERRSLISLVSPRGFGKLAEDVRIPLPENGKAAYLHFGQYTEASRPYICWKPLKKIGEYTVYYEDGMKETIPVEYAGNILGINCRYAKPLPAQYYRHNGYIGTWLADIGYEGKTMDGEDLLILDHTWKNPWPEKKITAIEYKDTEDTVTPVMLSYVEYTE